MNQSIDDLAVAKCAYVESDGPGFRRNARILQSIWRERANLPMGVHNGRPLGSRLPAELAERDLCNYLTPGIRSVVRAELAAAAGSRLFSKPRIYNDLLSSQPLCFNLFGELKLDLGLASEVMRALRPACIGAVSSIRFEYSPGRSNEHFTGDKSAFDVFVEYESINGGQGFLGIEVKYHENLKDPAAVHRPRYDEIARSMGCYKADCLARLHRKPLQQFWRDHLLAGSMLCDDRSGYSEGAFVVLYPEGNPYCRSAIREYRECLCDTATFDAWTLEEFVGALRRSTQAAWVEELWRYLDFDLVENNNSVIQTKQSTPTH